MNIGTLCKRHVVTVEASDAPQVAATRMREHHVGSLVVTEASPEGPRVVGVLTDRDLAIEVLARGADGTRASVADLIAKAPLVAADESAAIDEAVETMRKSGVRRLLVRAADGRLVGIVSFDDLLEACAAQLAALAAVARSGIEREATERATLAAAARPALRIPAVGTAGWSL